MGQENLLWDRKKENSTYLYSFLISTWVFHFYTKHFFLFFEMWCNSWWMNGSCLFVSTWRILAYLQRGIYGKIRRFNSPRQNNLWKWQRWNNGKAFQSLLSRLFSNFFSNRSVFVFHSYRDDFSNRFVFPKHLYLSSSTLLKNEYSFLI